jgi:regulatory protein
MSDGSPEKSAFDRALDLVSRRPLTRAELRRKLSSEGYGAGDVEETAARLSASGLLDDARLASHYLLTRSERLRHGRARLLSDLVRRGVERGVAERAWAEAVEAGDLDPSAGLAREVERRATALGGRLDEKRYARVYNALLRAGFEPERVEAALERYRSGIED